MVKVQILDLSLRRKYGEYAEFDQGTSVKLEKLGKIRIIDGGKKEKRPRTRQENMERQRRWQLAEHIPTMWKSKKSILNIGAYEQRFYFAIDLANTKATVDVLEIDENRCKWLRTQNWIRNVICADVMDSATVLKQKYDLIFWSHGPALLPEQRVQETIETLWKFTNKLIVIMTPWGKYKYFPDSILRDIDYNQTALYEKDFTKLGFNVKTSGRMNGGSTSQLIAWKERGK